MEKEKGSKIGEQAVEDVFYDFLPSRPKLRVIGGEDWGKGQE
jgi:hypothetical protein